MTVDDKKQVDLARDTLYYEAAGQTFSIKNTGEGPFEILITLIRVETNSTSADPATSI